MNILKPVLIAVANLVVLTHTVQAHYDPNIGRWISRDPIAEVGGVNLYWFVGNDGVNSSDLLGNERLTYTANIIHKRGAKALDGKRGFRELRFAATDDFDAPIPGAQSVSSIEEMAKKLEDAVKPYSPSGSGACNCIEKLIIWTHGGENYISFGNADLVDAQAFNNYDLVNRYPQLISLHWQSHYVLSVLRKLQGVLCEKSNVEFRSCDSGKDPDLASKLAQFLGEGKTVTAFPCKVAPGSNGELIQQDPNAIMITMPQSP